MYGVSCPCSTSEQNIPISIEENKLFEGAIELLKLIRPQWKQNDIMHKLFTDGITNKLIACFEAKDEETKDDVVLIRVYGNKTDLLIDRKAELRNMTMLHKEGLAPKVYAVFNNGLAYEYTKGDTISVDNVKDPNVWKLVARQMARMHNVKMSNHSERKAVLWDKSEQFLSTIPVPFSKLENQQRFVSKFTSMAAMMKEYETLKSYLSKVDSPVVFAHNDLLLGNVIYNADAQAIAFIDYEYADYNYQAYDIANHFAEFVGISNIDYANYPSQEFQREWIQVYLQEYNGGTVTDEQVERVMKDVEAFVLAAHFFWAVWALIQFEYSSIDFDFFEFAVIRMNEFNRLKGDIYSNLR